jgi:energy-coupling factor transport system ATP-binding protein
VHPEPDQLLRVRGLAFVHGARARSSLSDISFELERGKLVGLLGHAGSGKSTLLACIAGLTGGRASGDEAGDVVLEGASLGGITAGFGRGVGILLQDFDSQLVASSVELEVAFGLENSCTPRRNMEVLVTDYLRLVGLEARRHEDPFRLSGGQRQRLALASVLCLEPQLMLLDEPLSDADAFAQEQVMTLVQAMRRRGQSVIMAEHETDSLVEADGILLLQEGRLAAWAAAREVLTDTAALRAAGVRPPQLVELGQILGWHPLPLTEAEALEHCKPNRRPSAAPHVSDPVGAARPIIAVREATFVHPPGRHATIGPISLTIGVGEFVAIVGANGSGKTTLAKLMAGILGATEGSVRVAGLDPAQERRSKLAEVVGFAYQNPDHQIFSSTVQAEVEFGPLTLGMPADLVRSRARQAIAALHLDGYEAQDPFSLTKGERQRVAIASILAMGPRILVLDEPTTGLDDRQQQSLMRMLVALREGDRTIVITTHTTRIAVEFSSRIIVLDAGRAVLDGPPERVFRAEGVLAEAGVAVPPIVRLANRLGLAALSVPALADALEAGSVKDAR